jgi:hypothetical protein
LRLWVYLCFPYRPNEQYYYFVSYASTSTHFAIVACSHFVRHAPLLNVTVTLPCSAAGSGRAPFFLFRFGSLPHSSLRVRASLRLHSPRVQRTSPSLNLPLAAVGLRPILGFAYGNKIIALLTGAVLLQCRLSSPRPLTPKS